MPVATPMAKLMRNSLPQNFVRRRYTCWPVAYQAVWRMAIGQASPMVRGTKKKW
jgi:hypothetical protein